MKKNYKKVTVKIYMEYSVLTASPGGSNIISTTTDDGPFINEETL